jgi:hypothetical protein
MGGLKLGPKRYIQQIYLVLTNFIVNATQSNCGKPLKIDSLRIYSNINLAQIKNCEKVIAINIYRQSASNGIFIPNVQRLNVCGLDSNSNLRYSLVPLNMVKTRVRNVLTPIKSFYLYFYQLFIS